MTGAARYDAAMTSAADLTALLGRWEGVRQGEVPTIDAFRYREELCFARRAGQDSIHYEQRTWLVSDSADDGDPSHWESGFLLVQEDGSIDLVNAQASGRVEVLRGELESAGRLVLASVLHGNDARMVSARRLLEWSADELRYEVHMKTDQVDGGALHLRCRLTRGDRLRELRP